MAEEVRRKRKTVKIKENGKAKEKNEEKQIIKTGEQNG